LLSHGGNYPAELLTPAKKFRQNALAVSYAKHCI
jgi:hypothetical protein